MTIWQSARSLAERTPPHRNRSIDFYRALAILAVVFGHWLVNGFTYDENGLATAHILAVQPLTQFLTWLFQVMPIFFMVGGFANAVSWQSAARDKARRSLWVTARLNRLLLPVLPLILVWVAFAAVAHLIKFDPALAHSATKGGIVPTWFLAVYIMVTLLTPVTHWIWTKAGVWSIALFVLLAAFVDAIAFTAGAEGLRWMNYGFVWLAMHQLGYWWQRGDMGRFAPVLLIAFGAVTLWLLMGPLGYPRSMVGFPGQEVSNSFPPTFALFSLGTVQAGVMLLLERTVSRALQAPGRWAVVIMINARIMTIYLWHTTALIAVVGVAVLLDGIGMTSPTGSGTWWLARPVWLLVLAGALLPFVLAFGWVETLAQRRNGGMAGPVRAVAGAVLACWGIAGLALNGATGPNPTGVNLFPAAAAVLGILLIVWRRGTALAADGGTRQ